MTPPTPARPHPARLLPEASLGATRTSHRWAQLPGNWDRLNTRALYPSNNQWGIPDLPAASRIPARLVAYNDRRAIEAAGAAGAEGDASVHFFLDDYRFEVCWSKPQRALSRLARVGSALTPDFSLWANMPLAMQLWQVYRARWCGAWMLQHGITAIPTIGWSTPATYPFAFAGITPGSTVAISTVGIGDPHAKALFTAGYTEMLARLQPATVLVYGRHPTHLHPGPGRDERGQDGPGPARLAGPQVQVRCYPTRWQQQQEQEEGR